MSNKKQLKYIFIILVSLTILTLTISIITLIYQWIQDINGFGYIQNYYIIQIINCLGYQHWSFQHLALIFKISFIAIIITIALVTAISVILIVIICKYVKNNTQLQLTDNSQQINKQLVITNTNFIILYNLLSASIMTQIVNFGTIISFLFNTIKFKCSSFINYNLVIISTLSGISLLFLITNWVIIQILRTKIPIKATQKHQQNQASTKVGHLIKYIHHQSNRQHLDNVNTMYQLKQSQNQQIIIYNNSNHQQQQLRQLKIHNFCFNKNVDQSQISFKNINNNQLYGNALKTVNIIGNEQNCVFPTEQQQKLKNERYKHNFSSDQKHLPNNLDQSSRIHLQIQISKNSSRQKQQQNIFQSPISNNQQQSKQQSPSKHHQNNHLLYGQHQINNTLQSNQTAIKNTQIKNSQPAKIFQTKLIQSISKKKLIEYQQNFYKSILPKKQLIQHYYQTQQKNQHLIIKKNNNLITQNKQKQNCIFKSQNIINKQSVLADFIRSKYAY